MAQCSYVPQEGSPYPGTLSLEGTILNFASTMAPRRVSYSGTNGRSRRVASRVGVERGWPAMPSGSRGRETLRPAAVARGLGHDAPRREAATPRGKRRNGRGTATTPSGGVGGGRAGTRQGGTTWRSHRTQPAARCEQALDPLAAREREKGGTGRVGRGSVSRRDRCVPPGRGARRLTDPRCHWSAGRGRERPASEETLQSQFFSSSALLLLSFDQCQHFTSRRVAILLLLPPVLRSALELRVLLDVKAASRT